MKIVDNVWAVGSLRFLEKNLEYWRKLEGDGRYRDVYKRVSSVFWGG